MDSSLSSIIGTKRLASKVFRKAALWQSLQGMHREPEPTGNDGTCGQVRMGWEHPSPWASQISAIRFISVASVRVKDIQFEPQFTGTRDMVVTVPA